MSNNHVEIRQDQIIQGVDSNHDDFHDDRTFQWMVCDQKVKIV